MDDTVKTKFIRSTIFLKTHSRNTFNMTNKRTAHRKRPATTGIQNRGFEVLWWNIRPPKITPENPPRMEITPKVFSLIRPLRSFAFTLSIPIIASATMLKTRAQAKIKSSVSENPNSPKSFLT